MPSANGRGERVWVDADPTNRQLAGERHVKIGHGRNYADVPPVRSVHQGRARSTPDTSARMTRLDPQRALGRSRTQRGGRARADHVTAGSTVLW